MQLITALAHPEQYDELAKKKWWKVILYLVFWCFFVTTAVKLTDAILNGIKKEEIRNNIPEFQIQDGILQVEGVYEFLDESGTIYIMADTSRSDFTKEDIKGGASQEIYISKDKIEIYLLGKLYNRMFLSQMGMDGITKDQFVDLLYISLWVVAVILIGVEGVAFLFEIVMTVFMIVLIADIIAKYMRKRIAFGTLFKCGIYASTLGILAQLFQLFHVIRGVDYEPTVFYYLNYVLTMVYMVRVLLRWKQGTDGTDVTR